MGQVDDMQVRFHTFSQFHNKHPVVGSTYIRVNQLIKYWPQAALYKYGENPDVLIFQKVYMAADYQYPAHFPGIKILDICDPDWLGGLTGIKATIDAMDAITCPTEALAAFLRQLTDNPVVVIPDRYDLELVPEPKEHTKPARTVVWFGYRHNAETLKPAMHTLYELGLNLLVLADDDPLPWQWLPGQHAEVFRRERYTYMKHAEENIYRDLQQADFALLPSGTRPVDPFKSNNKTTKAILAGLPVARDGESLRAFVTPEARKAFIEQRYTQTKREYDVQLSIEQLKELIQQIHDSKAAKKPKPRLSPKRHKFCLLYATDSEFFGNGTLAYIEAYAIDISKKGAIKVATAAASRLLTNVNILRRIDELLNDGPMTDEEADKIMAFWMRQKAFPQTSVMALKEYNALQARITKKIELKTADPVGAVLDKFGLGEPMDAGEASKPASAPPKDVA